MHMHNRPKLLKSVMKPTSRFFYPKQDKSEGFDSCDRPSNLKLGFKSSIFQPVWPWNLMDDLEKQYGTSSILSQALCIISNPSVSSNWSYSLEMFNWGWNLLYFVLCDLEIWLMTLENNRAPLLYYIKLCVSFQIHRCSQIWVTVRKRSIRVKIGNFLSRVILKIDEWPSKTTGHLVYTTLSFLHHFKAMGEFKLELQSGNAQFGSKAAIFLSCVTLKFDGWPWKSIGYLSYAASSFVHHFIAIGKFKLEFQSGNSQFWSKSMIFFSRVNLKFDGWPRKTKGHLF